VLWNIKVSAKAALMVDMAVTFEQAPPPFEYDGSPTDFASMRDSMYLLLVMNQYTLKSTAHNWAKEAEGLLRIVLFSKDLVLTEGAQTLRERRCILAREVRETRRRGAVPGSSLPYIPPIYVWSLYRSKVSIMPVEAWS
jgi:hypothetical protein